MEFVVSGSEKLSEGLDDDVDGDADRDSQVWPLKPNFIEFAVWKKNN